MTRHCLSQFSQLVLPEWEQHLNMQLHIADIRCRDCGADQFTLCVYTWFSFGYYLCTLNTTTALPQLHNIFTFIFNRVLSCSQTLLLIPVVLHVQSEPWLDIRYKVSFVQFKHTQVYLDTHTDRCMRWIILTKRNILGFQQFTWHWPDVSLYLHITTVIFSQQTSLFTYYSRLKCVCVTWCIREDLGFKSTIRLLALIIHMGIDVC